jgi:AraC-like DNA-binding protein
VRYAEHPIPPALAGLVTAIWSLEGDGPADDRVAHEATPDGCIELIRRLRGQSWWDGEQPERFATGLSEAPVQFTMSGDAAFIGLRLWPWAWAMLGEAPAPRFAGRWTALDATNAACRILDDPDTITDRIAATLAERDPGPVARAVPAATSVAAIAECSGQSHRAVQRWFARIVGMPPRRYLRLIRFRSAMLDFADPPATLADHAHATGFADQAHMARDFRALAGIPPREARARALGPFLPGDSD